MLFLSPLLIGSSKKGNRNRKVSSDLVTSGMDALEGFAYLCFATVYIDKQNGEMVNRLGSGKHGSKNTIQSGISLGETDHSLFLTEML